jgi:hypothetical protein
VFLKTPCLTIVQIGIYAQDSDKKHRHQAEEEVYALRGKCYTPGPAKQVAQDGYSPIRLYSRSKFIHKVLGIAIHAKVFASTADLI